MPIVKCGIIKLAYGHGHIGMGFIHKARSRQANVGLIPGFIESLLNCKGRLDKYISKNFGSIF